MATLFGSLDSQQAFWEDPALFTPPPTPLLNKYAVILKKCDAQNKQICKTPFQCIANPFQQAYRERVMGKRHFTIKHKNVKFGKQ